MPVRAQETAPAPVEETTGSEDLRRMMRVLQHVADTTGASETDAAAGPVRTVRATAAPVETTVRWIPTPRMDANRTVPP